MRIGALLLSHQWLLLRPWYLSGMGKVQFNTGYLTSKQEMKKENCATAKLEDHGPIFQKPFTFRMV